MTVFHLPIRTAALPDGPGFAVTTALNTTQQVPFEDVRAAKVYIPAGSSITSLTFYDAPATDGTFLASYDDTATTPVVIALTGLGAGKSYPVPAKMYGSGAIKMVGDAAGTVYISMKG